MAESLFESIIPTLIQGIGGVFQTQQGAELKAEGFTLSAQGFRTAAVSTIAAANFNNELRQLNLDRQLDVLSREIREFTSVQRVSAAASGLSITSKSFLSVMDDTMGRFERQIIQSRNSTEQAKAAALFEAQAQVTTLENQARAADFQASFASFQASQTASKSLFSLGTNAVTSLLGDINANN